MKSTVIVAGAGAAGLMAAYELSLKNYDVTIVEASDRIGGRIHTYYQDGQIPMELGAEFVHGTLPLTLGLLKQADISYTTTLNNMHRVRQGQWQEEEELIEGWDELAEKLNNHPEDITLDNFLKLYFSAERYEKLRQSVVGMAEGLDLAESNKVSMQSLWEEWSHEQEAQYRIPGGYSQLITYLTDNILKKGGKIIKNFCINKIDWQATNVKVSTADGQMLQSDKLIIALPLSVLQRNEISFSPALPKIQEAANQTGWGKVIKFLLRFNSNLSNKKDLGIILSDEAIPTWWVPSSDDSSFLTGWLGGPKAENLEQLSEKALLDMAINSLSGIFNLPEEELMTRLEVFKVVKWGTVPFVEGGYSYDTPESTKAKQLLKTPIQQTLFFAGEAIYTGASKGTVEAALVSGQEAARFLDESMS